MKKAAFIILFLLVGVILGSPYWFGIQAERTYHAMMDRLSESGPVTVSTKDYQRGWLSSTAETVVEVHAPMGRRPNKVSGETSQKNRESFRLTLNHNVSHGPIPLAAISRGNFQLMPVLAIIDSTVALDSGTEAELSNAFGDISELQIHTTVSLGREGRSDFSLPPFTRSPKEAHEASIDWKGLSGHVTFSADFEKIGSFFSAPGLSIASEAGGLSVESVEFRADYRKGIEGLFLGDGSLSVGLFEARGIQNNNKPLTIKGWKVSGSSKESGGSITSAMNMQVGEIRVGDTSYGPGDYELVMRNLDAVALGKLQKEIKELQGRDIPDAQMGIIALGKMAAILPDLVKKSPELELTRLSLKTRDGEIQGKAKVTIDGEKLAGFSHPIMLVNAIEAEAEFVMPVAVAHAAMESKIKSQMLAARKNRQAKNLTDDQIDKRAASAAAQRLQSLVARKYIVRDGGNYRVNASYRQGKLMLNGQPMPLPLMAR